MKTQFDYNARVVSLENLKAMCRRVSTWSHRYEVSKVTRSRVHVAYSNPNEYGAYSPMVAVFPCYPFGDDSENPAVVLEYHNVLHDNWDGEGWQLFEVLRDCHELFRHNDAWMTREEIYTQQSDKREKPSYWA